METNTAKMLTFRAADGNTVYIECHDALSSTSALARQYAEAGYADKYAVFSSSKIITDLKRGRSKTENGLYLSVILRPSLFPSQAIFLTHLSALSLSLALDDHADKNTGIAWIGSVFCSDRKIGYATVEGKLDSFGAYEYLIVSFTAKLPRELFPSRLSDIVKKVFESDDSSLEMIIAKKTLDNFFPLYKNCKTPEKFIDAYRQKFILRGSKITCINKDGKRRRATVLGIDSSSGALLVENSSREIEKISSQKSISLPKRIKQR